MSDVLRNLRTMQGVYEKSPTSFPSTARLYKEAADEIERLSKQLVKQTEALEAARGEIVVAIAFLGRDAGTSRLDLTLNGVIARLVKADADARIALTDEIGGDAK